MKAVKDVVLKQSFVDVFNELMEGKEDFIKTMRENIGKVIMKINHKGDIDVLDENIEKFKEEIKKLVRLHMQWNMDAEIYNEEYKRLQDKLDVQMQWKELKIRAEIIDIVYQMKMLLKKPFLFFLMNVTWLLTRINGGDRFE